MKPRNIKSIQSRRHDAAVHPIGKYTFVVSSLSGASGQHVVRVRFLDDEHTVQARCTCAWARHRGVACTHVIAALEFLAGQKGRTLSFWLDEEIARRQHNRLFYLKGESEQDGVWITSRAA